MNNGTPAAGATATTPAAGGSSGFLGTLNTTLTAVGTAVAAVAAILSWITKTRVEELDRRGKAEQASYKFAQEFLTQISSNEKLKTHQRHFRAMLPALEIIAQASSNDTGESNAIDRAVLPIYMALILDEPGAVASMDAELKYAGRWVAVASVDDREQTRLTAIKALAAICRKALIDHNLGRLNQGMHNLQDLLNLLPNDTSTETKALRAEAFAAKAMLQGFLTRDKSALEQAKLLTDAKESAAEMRKFVQDALSDAVEKLQDAGLELRQAAKQQPSLAASGSETAPEKASTKSENASVKKTLSKVDLVLSSASQGAVEQAQAGVTSTTQTSGQQRAEATQKKVTESIASLTSKNEQERRAARSDLGLLGQEAVRPMLEEVEKRDAKNNEEDYKLRLGVAGALSRMRQPITLDPYEAKWVVSLLRSNDAETRVLTAEFLMDLWDGGSIRHAFGELEKIVASGVMSPDKNGQAVMNAAVIVGTWARNLNESIKGPDPAKPMSQVALEKARAWQEILKRSERAPDWSKTIATLDTLSRRAESARDKAMSAAATAAH